jgi:hypothetical protein
MSGRGDSKAFSRFSREKEGTRCEAMGRMRVFFFDRPDRVKKEDPHPTLSREKRERA